MLGSNVLQAAGQEALAVAASIDDEEVDVDVWWDLDKEWMLGEGGSESHPRVEKVGMPDSDHSHDAVVGRLHYREEFRAKSIMDCKWHMCQGMSCGKQVLKRVKRCISNRS